MKTLFYTLLVSLLIGCGGNSNNPNLYVESDVSAQTDWETNAPTYKSKVHYTNAPGLYKYYAQDKGTRFVLNDETDEFVKTPLTAVFSFVCLVDSEGVKHPHLTWSKGETLFLNHEEDVYVHIYINGAPVSFLDGVTTGIDEGTINIDKEQFNHLVNKMVNGGQMEVQVHSYDGYTSEVIIIRLKGFDKNHGVLTCFGK